jgi:hypothetical protein
MTGKPETIGSSVTFSTDKRASVERTDQFPVGRHYGSNLFHPSCGLLAEILLLFPRRLQFPIPLFESPADVPTATYGTLTTAVC